MERWQQYDLDNPKHVKELDELTEDALDGIFNGRSIKAEWDTPVLNHWRPGDERPVYADDDPAVQQAIGRCAVARLHDATGDYPSLRAAFIEAHPSECGWCDAPLEELLRVCDWATWQGRTQLGEWHIWRRPDHGSYRRWHHSGSRSARHAEFWALDKATRLALVRDVQYPVEAAA